MKVQTDCYQCKWYREVRNYPEEPNWVECLSDEVPEEIADHFNAGLPLPYDCPAYKYRGDEE